MESPKTQVLASLKKATNILVTVSTNPSVDQLSAAIGLAITLNRLGKHSTAVYSGNTPSTMEFLHPEKTLEKTTDSLRDFIIALDKSKADKLRYKVEDQMVKIFITPYHTSISDKDLEFSHGDFNVEVVMALGVNSQADLDQAITSHGRILHDATIIGLGTTGEGSIGSINWYDPVASSLCQMVATLGIELKSDVLDTQSATALLTGIVAETERFSNDKTSSETMQISSKLMSAGANQQLVASQLQKQPTSQLSVSHELPVQSNDVADLPEVVQQIDNTQEHKTPVITDVKSQKDSPLDSSLNIEPEPEPEPAPETEISPEPKLEHDESVIPKPDDSVTPVIPPLADSVIEPTVPAEPAQVSPSTTETIIEPTALPEPAKEPPAVAENPSDKPTEKPTKDGSLLINHGESRDLLGTDKSEPQDANQINIDEDGILKSAAELAAQKQKIDQAPLPGNPTIIPDAQQQMITQPPKLSEEETDKSDQDNYDPSMDPLGESKPTGPILSHDNSIKKSSNTSDEPSQKTSSDVPVETPDNLAELEKAVDSPHIDNARNAVNDAVVDTQAPVIDPAQTLDNNSSSESATGSPALPTNFVPSDTGSPADPSASMVVDATAPPPVPPPMIPVVQPPPITSTPNDTAL